MKPLSSIWFVLLHQTDRGSDSMPIKKYFDGSFWAVIAITGLVQWYLPFILAGVILLFVAAYKLSIRRQNRAYAKMVAASELTPPSE